MLTTNMAFADTVGSWTKLDLKVPVREFSNGMDLKLRVTPEFAFTNGAGGLAQTVFRAGPTSHMAKWFDLTLNGVSTTTGAKQDVRVEVQPEFTVSEGDFTFKDRNRFSYKTLDSAVGDRWQYANEFKVVYNVPQTQWNVYTAYEGYYDFSLRVGNQHRLMVGTGLNMSPNWHMDFGYMLRTQPATKGPWVNDNFVYVLVYNKK